MLFNGSRLYDEGRPYFFVAVPASLLDEYLARPPAHGAYQIHDSIQILFGSESAFRAWLGVDQQPVPVEPADTLPHDRRSAPLVILGDGNVDDDAAEQGVQIPHLLRELVPQSARVRLLDYIEGVLTRATAS